MCVCVRVSVVLLSDLEGVKISSHSNIIKYVGTLHTCDFTLELYFAPINPQNTECPHSKLRFKECFQKLLCSVDFKNNKPHINHNIKVKLFNFCLI